MRIPFSFKSEDALIYSIVSFALLYPVFITLVILYEDYRKKVNYRSIMLPIVNVALGKENCKSVSRIKDVLSPNLNLKDIEQICYKSRSYRVEKDDFMFQLGRDRDKVSYIAILSKKSERLTLRITAISEGNDLKVVHVDLN